MDHSPIDGDVTREDDHLVKSREPWRSFVKRAITLVALAIVSGGALASEKPSERSVADVLPPDLASGALHTVVDPVESDGYLDYYRIESRFEPIVAVG